MAGAGSREVAMFGGGECRCDIGIGVSAVVALRGWIAKLLGRAAECVCSDESSRFTFEGSFVRQAKAQVAAKGVKSQRVLKDGGDPTETQMKLKVTGATTASKPRQDCRSETLARAALLRCTGTRRNRLVTAYRIFVISKFGYGWVSRSLTQGTCNRFFTGLSQALQLHT